MGNSKEYMERYRAENKERIRQQNHEKYLRTKGQDRERQAEHTSVDFSGIYGLYCSETGQWYIGQSVHVLRRLREHMKRLIAGSHYNAKLQDAFTHHGITSFSMNVLCVCPYEELTYQEHKHITKYNSQDAGMNLYTPTPDDM
jgi:hypothetical protein